MKGYRFSVLGSRGGGINGNECASEDTHIVAIIYVLRYQSVAMYSLQNKQPRNQTLR